MIERADRDPEIEPIRDQLVAAGTRQTADLVRQAIATGRLSDAVEVEDHVANLCGPLVHARLCRGTPMNDQALEYLVDLHLRPPAS